ncbi:MAG: Ni/Fe hydrogenase subunit alpha [Solirubrobacteraceae bacterium]
MSTDRRTLAVDVLARVEGEGAMHVRIDGDEVADVQLRIYEPPRFFEAFLRGRAFTEAPDITARICGICPVAYQTSAIRAMEDVCGIAIDDGPIRALRRLLYCGEWLESHALHVHLLHAPDFLGYESGIAMAADHREVVERGLLMKKAGTTLMAVVGGREIHPINVRVGGFYRAPTRAELAPAAELLERALEAAIETVRWTGTLPFPDFGHDHELVALSADGEYPIDRGRIVSSSGLDISPGEFDDGFVEEPVAHSNALHARIRGRGAYLAGPLARFNLNFDRLSPAAREAALAAGVGPTCRNPFQSIVVRAVEMLYACEEALRIIAAYEPPDPPAVEVVPRAAVGFGVSEAPRGMLWHRYELDAAGTILDARIVPPTSQNQLAIEHDLRAFVQRHVRLPDDELRDRCEQAIRNHDPCISCATHFLTLDVERT